MEWCCSLDRRTSEGVRMKRPDRGAEGYDGGVASSSALNGRKVRGQGRSSRDGRRAIHIRRRSLCPVPATREKHLIRSLSRHALLLPASCHSQIFRSLSPSLQSHSPPDPRLSRSLPSLTKRHSPFPFQNSLQKSLSIRSLFKFKFISFSARLSAQSPSSPSRRPVPYRPFRQI
jgi:hypothetical protein